MKTLFKSETEENLKLADFYKSLVVSHMNQFNATRELKWKINIAIIGFFAAAIIAASKDLNPGFDCDTYDKIFYGLVFFSFIHLSWMYLVQESLEFDKTEWVKHRETALSKIEETGKRTNSHPEDKNCKKVWKILWNRLRWPFIETSIIFLLGLFTILVLYSSDNKVKNLASDNKNSAAESAAYLKTENNGLPRKDVSSNAVVMEHTTTLKSIEAMKEQDK